MALRLFEYQHHLQTFEPAFARFVHGFGTVPKELRLLKVLGPMFAVSEIKAGASITQYDAHNLITVAIPALDSRQ